MSFQPIRLEANDIPVVAIPNIISKAEIEKQILPYLQR